MTDIQLFLSFEHLRDYIYKVLKWHSFYILVTRETEGEGKVRKWPDGKAVRI